MAARIAVQIIVQKTKGEPALNTPTPNPAKMQPTKGSFHTPDWAKHAVWYQIFPERFRNGDPSNNPPRTVPWTHEWYRPYNPERTDGSHRFFQPGVATEPCSVNTVPTDQSSFAEKGSFYEYIYGRRYGGDIQGIREQLPYLRDLGVTALYLTPVFLAESLHKYDATDFRHIDDHFGIKDSLKKIKGETADPATWQWSKTDLLFLDFIKEAHRYGFKVILDGVFNHTGRAFWAFQDILKNGKDSPYADWFDIESWEPFEYRSWDNDLGALPRLKHDDALGLAEPVRQHLFAITRRWMDPHGNGNVGDGIDGWRLDVAEDINANFWRDWRKLVKSINPEAYIVAEIWHEAKEWLDGSTFDAVMNYQFTERCHRFFVFKKKAITPARFAKEIEDMLSWYPMEVNYVLQNLFGSHDTDRTASMFMNPDIMFNAASRLQDNGPQYNPAKPTPPCYRRMKLAVTFQMTFLGAPMVYYGDEVGMYGADDPSNRKPMLWKDLLPYDDPDECIEDDILDHYRLLIAIRNTYASVRIGDYKVLMAKNALRTFAFARTHGNETIVVVLNNSDRPHRLKVPVPWPEGSRIVRLDDPRECELVAPSADDPTARPQVRPIVGCDTATRIENGHLRGPFLPPRTGGVYIKVD